MSIIPFQLFSKYSPKPGIFVLLITRVDRKTTLTDLFDECVGGGPGSWGLKEKYTKL